MRTLVVYVVMVTVVVGISLATVIAVFFHLFHPMSSEFAFARFWPPLQAETVACSQRRLWCLSCRGTCSTSPYGNCVHGTGKVLHIECVCIILWLRSGRDVWGTNDQFPKQHWCSLALAILEHCFRCQLWSGVKHSQEFGESTRTSSHIVRKCCCHPSAAFYQPIPHRHHLSHESAVIIIFIIITESVPCS